MAEDTKEQKQQLVTWAEKRDSLLSEIAILKDSKLKLERANKELADSNSDIESRMLVIQGRIQELKILNSLSKLFLKKNVKWFQL